MSFLYRIRAGSRRLLLRTRSVLDHTHREPTVTRAPLANAKLGGQVSKRAAAGADRRAGEPEGAWQDASSRWHGWGVGGACDQVSAWCASGASVSRPDGRGVTQPHVPAAGRCAEAAVARPTSPATPRLNAAVGRVPTPTAVAMACGPASIAAV